MRPRPCRFDELPHEGAYAGRGSGRERSGVTLAGGKRMSEISAIRLYRADLPLAARLEHASASEPVLEEVFLRLSTASGVEGFAEVRGNGVYATGADVATVLGEVADDLGPRLRGVGLAEASSLIGGARTSSLARALADGAVLDATAREAGQPLWQLLGGRRIAAVPTHFQVGFCTVEQGAERARAAARMGFRRVKVRVGRPAPEDDIALVRACRYALGEDVAIALDANGAWDVEIALRTLRAVEPQEIAWIEQPTPPADIDALRAVRRSVAVPVIADEAVRTAGDLSRLCAAGAVDGVHLKLEKAGTVAALRALADQARTAGLMVLVGQMDQGRLGSSLTVHIAAAVEAQAYELWGFQNVVRDVTAGLEMRDGCIPLPVGPGTGVEVDARELTLVREIA